MYYAIYDLFTQYVYGLDVALTSWQELTATIYATTACLFVVSLPFVIVFLVVRALLTWRH